MKNSFPLNFNESNEINITQKKLKTLKRNKGRKSFKEISTEKLEKDDKELNEEIAKKMINAYYFTD